jgi:hypothetical protein
MMYLAGVGTRSTGTAIKRQYKLGIAHQRVGIAAVPGSTAGCAAVALGARTDTPLAGLAGQNNCYENGSKQKPRNSHGL